MSGSPFTWRVAFALEHKRLGYELRWLSPDRGDLRTPAFARLNPRKQAPVLSDGDIAVYESDAIVRYLEAAYPKPSLFPGSLSDTALAYRLIAEFDNYFVPSMEELVRQFLYESDPAQRDQAKIAAADAKLQHELAHFERALDGEFLAGPLSAADFSLYPGIMLLLRIEKRQPNLAITGQLGPALSSWMQRIEALPYYERTYPPHWRMPPKTG